MNDDLKPGALVDSITPQRAFEMAEIVALRFSERCASEASKLVADAISLEISELARAWRGDA